MYFAILNSLLLKKVKACQHLDCGQMQGKSFGSFWLFWTQLHHWCSLKALWEDVKKNLSLAFYKWTHYSPLRGSLYGEEAEGWQLSLGLKAWAVGQGCFGVDTPSAVPWYDWEILAGFLPTAAPLTLQRCFTFPHLSALWIHWVVSDCFPGGLEFPEGTLGSAKLGVGPNNWTLGLLTWPEPEQLSFI